MAIVGLLDISNWSSCSDTGFGKLCPPSLKSWLGIALALNMQRSSVTVISKEPLNTNCLPTSVAVDLYDDTYSAQSLLLLVNMASVISRASSRSRGSMLFMNSRKAVNAARSSVLVELIKF